MRVLKTSTFLSIASKWVGSIIVSCNLHVVIPPHPCYITHSRHFYPVELFKSLERSSCYLCHFINETYILEIFKNQYWLQCDFNWKFPVICSQIYPLFGPKQGGTLLTIDGIDLGKSYEDIVNGISVAGAQCSPIRKEYVVSKQWVRCLPCLSSLNQWAIFLYLTVKSELKLFD